MYGSPRVISTNVDGSAATERLLRLLSVEGITGQEARIAKEIQASLREAGVPAKAIRFDDAQMRIPEPTQTGNLLASLPGVGHLREAKPILFLAHMDTVPLCAGAKPKLAGKKIVNEVETALGGDNRTGCAVLVTLAAELARHKLPHPPIILLFTVREESGLFGARHVQLSELADVGMAFNFDGREACEITVGAVGADRWEVEIFGKASHAGVHPEQGISATAIFALGLAAIYEQGWFGKVEKDGREGTTNVGSIDDGHGGSAGVATNVVTDYLRIRGESRSHDAKFVRELTAAYKTAFTTAATRVTDHSGKSGKVKFTARQDYHPFRLKENAPVVQLAKTAVRSIGREPVIRTTNGGLDANWLVKHGIPTVTFGAGQNEIHTIKEWVDLVEYEAACRLAIALATAEVE